MGNHSSTRQLVRILFATTTLVLVSPGQQCQGHGRKLSSIHYPHHSRSSITSIRHNSLCFRCNHLCNHPNVLFQSPQLLLASYWIQHSSLDIQNLNDLFRFQKLENVCDFGVWICIAYSYGSILSNLQHISCIGNND